jgi:ATP/maltotriose-dependent transcriptional regulator MalT
VSLYLGLLASLEGRQAEAETLLEESISRAKAYGSPFFEAYALAYRAEIAARAGDPEAAEQNINQAARVIADTGYEPMVEHHARFLH